MWIFYDLIPDPILEVIEGYSGGVEKVQWWVKGEVYNENEIFLTKEIAEMHKVMDE